MYHALIDRERAVLRLSGPDVRAFLQDIVTNDITPLAKDCSVYAALLSPQGKYLFDFFLTDADDPALPGAVFLDVDAGRAPLLAQRLTLYRLRRDVTIEFAERSVVLLWREEDVDLPDGEPAGAVRDPRHPALGWRHLTDAPEAFVAGLGAAQGDLASYRARRVGLGVPETGLELLPEETYILEVGFERFHGVDFKKGCYVGQEVTARMKHKTELRKGLARVSIDGEAVPGTPVTSGEKQAGTLHSVAGSEGLAHLRFDRASGDMQAGTARLTLIEKI